MKPKMMDTMMTHTPGSNSQATSSKNTCVQKPTSRDPQSPKVRQKLAISLLPSTGDLQFASDSIEANDLGKFSAMQRLMNLQPLDRQMLNFSSESELKRRPLHKLRTSSEKSNLLKNRQSLRQPLVSVNPSISSPLTPHPSQKPLACLNIEEINLLRNPMIKSYMNPSNPYLVHYKRALLSRRDFKRAAGQIQAERSHFESSISMYRIQERIGSGSFGEVYKALQLSSNLPVALKVLPRSLFQDKNLVSKLQTEIGIIKQLSGHPSILQLYESFRDENNFYFVFEYMPERDLSHFFTNNRAFDEEDLAFLTFKILEGIKYIHSKDIIHRDIKPENILLDKHLRPRIGDFGLSSYTDNLTLEKDTCGTPTYLAPEVFVQGESVSKKTDLWSLGILLYKLKYNRLPFDGDSYDELYKNILTSKIVLHEGTRISQKLADFLDRLLQRDQRKRMNVQQAMDHPWLAQVSQAESSKFAESKFQAILRRAAVLFVLEQLGFSPEFVLQSIKDELFNHCSACYWNLVNNSPL